MKADGEASESTAAQAHLKPVGVGATLRLKIVVGHSVIRASPWAGRGNLIVTV